MVPSPNASAGRDLLVGIDAGTSVIKAVAFDLAGRQIAVASVPNRYTTNADGAAFQSLDQTWADCAQTLRDLGAKVEDLARRTAAVAVTGQGDGTWLVGAGTSPRATRGYGWMRAPRIPCCGYRATRQAVLASRPRVPGSRRAVRARRSRIWIQRRPKCSIAPKSRCIARTGCISTSPGCAQRIRRKRASLTATSAPGAMTTR